MPVVAKTAELLSSLLLLAGLSVLASGCSATPASGRADGEVACPSIHIPPHASLNFTTAIKVEGTYNIAVEADGTAEQCTLVMSAVGGSTDDGVVSRSPTTQTRMDCKSIRVSGITNDGHIAGFKTVGTPAQLKITVKRGTSNVTDADVVFNYTPSELHGRGCTKTKHASATLKIAGQ